VLRRSSTAAILKKKEAAINDSSGSVNETVLVDKQQQLPVSTSCSSSADALHF
jgi:hypothetical protein